MVDHLPATVEDYAFGPAMSALRTDLQRGFVIAYNNMGADDATKAARAAGYEDNGTGALKVTAYRLLHNPDIQAAIREDAKARMAGLVGAAIKALGETIGNPQHKDRVKASLAVLNRTGLHEQVDRNINVNVNITREEKLDRVRQLAEILGRDPAELLGKVVDAEFEDAASPGTEGMEDFL